MPRRCERRTHEYTSAVGTDIAVLHGRSIDRMFRKLRSKTQRKCRPNQQHVGRPGPDRTKDEIGNRRKRDHMQTHMQSTRRMQ